MDARVDGRSPFFQTPGQRIETRSNRVRPRNNLLFESTGWQHVDDETGGLVRNRRKKEIRHLVIYQRRERGNENRNNTRKRKVKRNSDHDKSGQVESGDKQGAYRGIHRSRGSKRKDSHPKTKWSSDTAVIVAVTDSEVQDVQIKSAVESRSRTRDSSQNRTPEEVPGLREQEENNKISKPESE